MRKLMPLLFLLLPLVGVGQNWDTIPCQWNPIQFCNAAFIDTINPVDDPELFEIDSNTLGCWQYGSSHKSFFDSISSFSGWVTDSIQPYAFNADDFFTVKIRGLGWNITQNVPFIMFEHKYSCDQDIDGGFVEYSCDGEHWKTIGSPNYMYGFLVQQDNYFELTAGSDLYQDSIPFLASTANDWKWSSFIWEFNLAAAKPIDELEASGCSMGFGDLEDSLLVRFHFVSDSIQDDENGWMIRNIAIGLEEDLFTSISETNYNPLSLYPNPTTSTIRIQLPENNLNATRTSIYDMTGRLVHQQPFNPNLNVGYLDRGTYIVVVETEEGNFRGTVQKR